MGTGEGGVIFNPEIYIADFGNFKQGFLSMKLIQNSNFRVQGMFFNNCIVLHLSLEIMCMHFILSSPHMYLLAYMQLYPL